MTSIEAGPYELTKQSKDFYEKVTFCIMDDNSISKRVYNRHGNVMKQEKIPMADISSAIVKLESLISDCNKDKYVQEPQQANPAPLAKRPKVQAKSLPKPQPALKKREAKEESKEETKDAAVRKSTRQAGKPQPIYSEEKIDKILFEADHGAGDGSGAIKVMLAQTYDETRDDPSGWLMSEKLDGVRCYWNGATMFTRNGNQIHAPEEWVKKLPSIALDGELWSGRDNFQSIVSIVRRNDPDVEKWKTIKFMVFDGPLLKGNFSQRLKILQEELAKKPNDTVKLIEQTKCNDKKHLLELMDKICGGKGEGVMLKDPKSKYEGTRSYSLLKVKRFEDAEATVIGHHRGTGRCDTMCGAIQVREKDGTEFKIGSGFTDAQRRNPPKKGSVVTFKFQGRSTAGIPRFPIFLRIHPGM